MNFISLTERAGGRVAHCVIPVRRRKGLAESQSAVVRINNIRKAIDEIDRPGVANGDAFAAADVYSSVLNSYIAAQVNG